MSENFKSLPNFPKNDVNRVKYFIKKLNLNNEKLKMKTEKCAIEALAARNDGNLKFAERDNVEALKAYNESLCWAPVGSEDIGIAYGNRSAIYLKCGFYKYCLENIELAMENNYPERLKLKLIKRKEKCLQKMKVEEDAEVTYDYKNLSKLSYPANKKIPFMIEGLELKKNEKYGRYVVTNRDLNIGDIVMIEKPFVKSNCPDDNKTVYLQCFYCCKSNFFNLKPCPKSVGVMFCSTKCSEDAWNDFYQYECPIIDGIHASLSSVRCHIILKAITLLGDVIKLKELLDLAEKEQITVFDVDYNEIDDITKFRILFSTVSNWPKTEQRVISVYARVALVYSMLKELPHLKKHLQTKELQNIFMEVCIRIELKIHSILHGFGYYWPIHMNTEHFIFSQGLFLASSLLNHSCVANINRVAMYGQNYLVVMRPIQAGEQLFTNYSGRVKPANIEKRREFLNDTCNFICDCEACTFETHRKLQSFDEVAHVFLIEFPRHCELCCFIGEKNCPFDDATLSAAIRAEKEISEYLKCKKLKYSPVLLALLMSLSHCSWIKVARKTLKVMLTQKN